MDKMELLKKIIVLAKERRIEDKKLEKKFGVDELGTVYPPDENTLNYHRAPRPKEEQLKNFIDGLTPEELNFVATIMYGGRDHLYHGGAGDYKTLSEYLRERKGLNESIQEKMELDLYLLAGIEVFKGKPEVF